MKRDLSLSKRTEKRIKKYYECSKCGFIKKHGNPIICPICGGSMIFEKEGARWED